MSRPSMMIGSYNQSPTFLYFFSIALSSKNSRSSWKELTSPSMNLKRRAQDPSCVSKSWSSSMTPSSFAS
ncbi:hypothetical protein AR158_c567R [Paramecium bursaria Chlorella virus AR158]|uniref:hypothetical protein n=1 Tax=Paramecium bursaria Chlorella virus AR158 TaxID=380598 RepID=UPI00015AA785|nr:hypothetical protein AR158_c567R [Paramecium bursaria Chlorella virus AR158]ABU44112.1 hypothetical protein AR158_c567R [Paramecium bursaria Chlorella virus AR158]